MVASIPKCRLTDLLREKTEDSAPSQFAYVSELSALLDAVSKDVPLVQNLFPQFTPHDTTYHLEPLFHLASDLLLTTLDGLNAAELFLLACALDAHDWGMAVDKQHEQDISLGPSTSRWQGLVERDRKRLLSFAQDNNLAIDSDSGITCLTQDLWRDFVRRTHAQRSADRVRNHFESIDTGVAIRLSQLCQSHGEDCETLRDGDLYPIRCSVLGEVVNVRAIAIYLRLCDLFDLADNRTPYVLWKHVAPNDPRSIREWDKHRAIRKVTFPPYPGNCRHILVDGLTSDHELYSDLLDLEAYCRNELRLCSDMLSEMPDAKYSLDIVDIDWRIKAEGFEPLPIRFEFDRNRMLGFVSRELYKGDKLVFLRELLQNSIDAIRMRRELLKRIEPNTDLDSFGHVEVYAHSRADGSMDIVWKDDGIGMNESVVRNFFSVVGRSYYRSRDFERLGLTMDPISEFGIGFLTCFVVSDAVEIVTKRDQNIFDNSKPLRIVIPGVDRHFRVEVLQPASRIPPGTMVRLTISAKSLASAAPDQERSKIITNYLAKIAGFVEFPIVIQEEEHKTIILHPKANRAASLQHFGSDHEVIQLQLDWALKDMFVTEDVPLAERQFKLETYDMEKDLKLVGYEGALVYPVPRDEDTDFTRGPREYDALRALASEEQNASREFVRTMYRWQGRLIPVQNHFETGFYETNGVYRDGILVPNVRIPSNNATRHPNGINWERLVVNIPKSKSRHISLARDEILSEGNEWSEPVFAAHVEALAAKSHSVDMKALPAPVHAFRLASFMLFHGLSMEQLAHIFPKQEWPFPFLSEDGCVKWKRYDEFVRSPIRRSPDPLSRVSARLLFSVIKNGEIPPICGVWRGVETLIDDWATWGGSNGDSIVLASLRDIIGRTIEASHRFHSIVFVTAPWEGSPPLLQEEWYPRYSSDNLPHETMEASLARLARDPSYAAELEQPCLQEYFCRKTGLGRWHPRLVKFPNPFAESFAYGSKAMNLAHPIVRALLHLRLIMFGSGYQARILPSDLNSIKLVLGRVANLPGTILSDYASWAAATDDLWRMLEKVGLATTLGVRTLTPRLDEFVSGSTEQFLDIKVRENWSKPFGQKFD